MQSTSPPPIPARDTPSVQTRVARRSRRTPILSNAPITLGTIPLLPSVRNTPLSTSEELVDSNTTSANLQSTPPVDFATIPIDAMKFVVQETLRQMGVEGIHVSRPASSSSSKTRSRARSSAEVKMQQSLMSKDDDLAWKVS